MATVTESIRLGPSVTPLPIRHPYLLAKMAASVDQLSEGRLMMGVGGGWYREEFQWVNAPFLTHANRLAQTEEALQLIRSLWTESVTTFRGDYYRVDALRLEPKPIQQPHPPFFLGGGSLRILELTAQYGRGWMPFAPSTLGLIRRLQQLNILLDSHKRKLSELEIVPSILLQFGKSVKDAQRRLPKWGRPPNETRAIFGPPAKCLARIQEYTDAGATHLALRLVHPDEFEQNIKIIVQEIQPHL
jgi:alkanesulfonate monooxygenase SsuD/methylene tetrahydromethanopterin reductase-like flavin-dependent oxidoreductase (luciferase family)